MIATNQHQNIIPIPGARYCKIKKNDKAPIGRDWQNNLFTFERIKTSLYRNNNGYGIVYGENFSGIDIDNPIAANIFKEHFGMYAHEFPAISWCSGKKFNGEVSENVDENSNITVLFKHSNEDKELLVTRLAGYKNSFDIRTGKHQSVLPSHSLHPDTKKPYFWHHSPLEFNPGEYVQLQQLIDKIIAYKLEHNPSEVYDAETVERALSIHSKNKEEYEQYLAGNNPDFKHTPATFMAYEIEPYFSDYPELLYDGGHLGNHEFLSAYQEQNRKNLTRLAGDPLWRESSSKKSLVLFVPLEYQNSNYKIWRWRDHGIDLGGNVLKYRHYLLTHDKKTRYAYPNAHEGWLICAYYLNKLKNLPGCNRSNIPELPKYALQSGIYYHTTEPDKYFISEREIKTTDSFEWSDFFTLQNDTLTFDSEAFNAALEFGMGEYNEPIKIKINEDVDVKQIYADLRKLGIKTIIDRRGTGAGKTYNVGSLRPEMFNEDIDDLGLQYIQYLRYIHPLNHRNASVGTLADWSQEPVRHGGLIYTNDGRKQRAKYSHEHRVKFESCIRYEIFEKSYQLNLDLQVLNEKGNLISKPCLTCPVAKDCATGVGRWTYRFDKYHAQFNKRTRISPESLGSPEVQDGSRKGFRYENSIGIYDEIDSHELQKTYRFTAQQLLNAVQKLERAIDRYNAVRTMFNQQPRVFPEALKNWLNTVYFLMINSPQNVDANLRNSLENNLEMGRYGLPATHEIFNYDLGLLEGELEFLVGDIDTLYAHITETDLDFIDEGRDLFDAIEFMQNSEGEYVPYDLDRAKLKTNLADIKDIGNAALLLDMLKVRAKQGKGAIRLEKRKKPEILEENQDFINEFTEGLEGEFLADDNNINDFHNNNYDIVFTIPNYRYLNSFKAFDMSIILDATINPATLIKTLEIPMNQTVQIVQDEPNITENSDSQDTNSNNKVSITQIHGLGRLGIERGEEQKTRLKALIETIKSEYAENEIGVFDFKKFHAENNKKTQEIQETQENTSNINPKLQGIWGRDNRGSNDFERCKALIITGVLTPNFNALVAEFICVFNRTPSETRENVSRLINAINYNGFVTSTNLESTDVEFRDFVFQKIQSELNQCFGRLRANRRNEHLDVYFISDFPCQYPVILKHIADIDPLLLDSKNKNYHLIYQLLNNFEATEENPKITAKQISKQLDISQATVSRALYDLKSGNCDQWLIKNHSHVIDKIIEFDLVRNDKFKKLDSNSAESMQAELIHNIEIINNNQNQDADMIKTPENTYVCSNLYPTKAPENIENGTVKPDKARDIVWASPVLDKKKRESGKTDYLNVDESKLDLFTSADYVIPAYTPKEIKPYSDLKILFLDIETVPLPEFLTDVKAALDPEKARITHIGLKGNGSFQRIYTDENEAAILADFIHDLTRRKNVLDVLALHNGHNFDIPFIIKRCEVHNIQHPFVIDSYTSTINATSVFGNPIRVNQARFNAEFNAQHESNIVDTYILLGIEENIKRQLKGLSLKEGALVHGRESQRLELSAEEICSHWYSNNPALRGLVSEYLRYDLEDTELLTNDLLPAFYYQLKFIPDATIQSLISQGSGGKWNKILQRLISEEKGFNYNPKPTETTAYQGGKTYGSAGLHKNVAKIDVSSMYPGIMLKYGLCPDKDESYQMLAVLNYLRDERFRNKAIAKDKTGLYSDKQKNEANLLQAALKVLINSAYGLLGVKTNFNDPVAAALVTAYGRGLLDFMVEKTVESGGTIIEIDTDGIIFSLPELEDKDENFNQFHDVFKTVKNALPELIDIDLEFIAKGAYIPLNTKEKNPEINGTGQRKNYMVFFEPGQKPIIKGRFRKRNVCKLENEFAVKFAELYISESPDKANEYYQNIINELQTKLFDLDSLTITKTVSKSDVEMQRLGLGKPGTKVSYWIGANGVKTNNQANGYSVWHYQQIIHTKHTEFMSAINPNYVAPAYTENGLQLSLFN